MITEFVIPNSLAKFSLAGAIIEDDTGLMKVKELTIKVATHLRWTGQLNLYIQNNTRR